jgi:hypothetical protein
VQEWRRCADCCRAGVDRRSSACPADPDRGYSGPGATKSGAGYHHGCTGDSPRPAFRSDKHGYARCRSICG